MRGVVAAVLALVLAGCQTTRSGLAVDLSLISVQRPQDVAERWGDYTLEAADSSGFTYEDGLLSLAVVPLAGTFSAVVENRTEHSIRLLWGEGSYVGPSSLSSAIVPGSTRWIDMGNAPAPQIIPSHSRAAIVVIPMANANRSAMTIHDFYPTSGTCNEVSGTTVRLILPIEIQGVINEYTLQFEPQGAQIVTFTENTLAGTSREESRMPCRDR